MSGHTLANGRGRKRLSNKERRGDKGRSVGELERTSRDDLHVGACSSKEKWVSKSASNHPSSLTRRVDAAPKKGDPLGSLSFLGWYKKSVGGAPKNQARSLAPLLIPTRDRGEKFEADIRKSRACARGVVAARGLWPARSIRALGVCCSQDPTRVEGGRGWRAWAGRGGCFGGTHQL